MHTLPFPVASLALGLSLTALSACGSSEPSAEDMINDATDTAAGIEKASAELSPELAKASQSKGDLPCALPAVPDARLIRSTQNLSETANYNTAQTPEAIAAFYKAASKAQGASATSAGIPGMTEVKITFADGKACAVTAQSQPTGEVHVQIFTNDDL